MKIIIAGAGEVGFHLAKLLSFESQEITLIDNKKDSLSYAGENLDIKTIKGDATSIATLKDGRIENSELFWIDKCGHAPMMEHPQEFNRILKEWLDKNK